MTLSAKNPREIADLRSGLLAWYAQHRRDLPWRQSRDPYAIWISETMLQQTRVAVVVERYLAFLRRFPTLRALASAREQDVLALWSGLGYYRRARLLHKAARVVVQERDAVLPRTADELRKLPGIGAYTAAAIASIAYGERVAVVDGNVERVLCRMAGWDSDGTSAGALKRKIDALAGHLVDAAAPGDFNQAMMELGATLCLPRNPRCLDCPVRGHCKTRGEHKTAPRPPAESREIAYALAMRASRNKRKNGAAGRSDRTNEVLLQRRLSALSVMPGMWELPALRDASVAEPELRMTVRHAIMQVNYVAHIRAVDAGGMRGLAGLTEREGRRRWVPLDELGRLPLTGLTRKVLTRARLLQAQPQ